MVTAGSDVDLDPVPGADQPRWPVALFDFDGTLGDSIELIISSFRAAAIEVLDYTFDEDLVRDWIGRPLVTMMGQHGVADPDGVMTVYRRHYKAAHNDLLKPFDGISELLQRLNGAGVRIGVVSSKKSDYLQLGLQALGLDRWVRLLIGADETELHKPAHGKLVVTASQDHSLKVWDLRRRQLIDLIAPARRTHRRA